MKSNQSVLIVVLAILTGPALYGVQTVNVDKQGLALQGYDPVAYFTDGKPVKGNPAFSHVFKGATYHFTSEDHLKMFVADPERYEPQFGGYCAYGVAAGGLYPIDVEAFSIFEGRLLLQKSKSIRRRFNRNPEGNYQKAVQNWPKLQEKP